MTHAAADSLSREGLPATPGKPGEDQIPDPLPSNFVWTWKKLCLWVLLAVIVHLILICVFGTRSQIIPRTISHIPRLQLAADSDPLIALGDPTLFALPNPKDFSSVTWSKVPAVPAHAYRWSESPHWLSLAMVQPGATFEKFAPSVASLQVPLEVKPASSLAWTPSAIGSALPSVSSLKILGSLAGRRLLSSVSLPSLPYDNVIPPSRIQLVVDQAGRVVSAVLLPSTDSILPSTDSTEALERCDAADQRALEIARQLRFAPAEQLDLGEIVFSWHAVPVRLNNTPSGM